VRAIEGPCITVENSYGNQMHVSRDILEQMSSASHFAKDVPLNMTALAELLETVGDTVLSVQFRKKPNEAQVAEKIASLKPKDLKDAGKLSKITKELLEGETVTMVCHLIDSEANLGRSTVIDFSAATANKFRQVDHRTIDHIIFKNVRYILKKGGKKASDEDMEPAAKGKDEPKWNYS
jgi:ribosomal protein L18E